MRVGMALFLLLLAACDTAADDAARKAQIDSRDDATCRGYGLQFGTDAYAQCRERLQQQRADAAMTLLQHRQTTNCWRDTFGNLHCQSF